MGKVGKGKLLSSFTMLFVLVGLMMVPLAGAYVLPKKPGTPGGPPTKPKKGNTTTKTGATKVGDKTAGDTGSELAKEGKFTVTVTFPSGGAVTAKIASAGLTLGGGSTSKAKKGNKKLTVTFNKKGKAFLNKNNGTALKLTIRFTFNPNQGKTQTSTTTITLDA
jgi:hypothetical protein